MVITKEKMSSVAKYVLVNGLIFVAVWFGMVKGVKGAENVALFFLWFFSLCSLGYTNKEVIDKLAKRKEYPAVPQFIDVSYDLTILTILIWYSYWVTGIVYLIHIGLCMSLREAVKNRREEMKEEKG